jgi:hypothetical protein
MGRPYTGATSGVAAQVGEDRQHPAVGVVGLGQPELGEDVPDVLADRRLRDDQRACDRGVGLTRGDEGEDLPSEVYQRPSYQNEVAKITRSPMRSVPDITADASDGTSEATPITAGPGFDVATGWGTVFAPKFVPALLRATAELDTAQPVPRLALRVVGQHADHRDGQLQLLTTAEAPS